VYLSLILLFLTGYLPTMAD